MVFIKKKKLGSFVFLLITSAHWIIKCQKFFFDSQTFNKNNIRLPKRRYANDIVSNFHGYESNKTLFDSLHQHEGIKMNSYAFPNHQNASTYHTRNDQQNKIPTTHMQCASVHQIPKKPLNLLFVEMFQDDFFNRWFTLKETKSQGKWSKSLKRFQHNTNDYGLKVSSSMQHHSILSHFNKPIVIKRHHVFILSLEIQYPQSYECGSSSITLYSKQSLPKWNVLSQVQNEKELPYSIRFAVNICGNRLSLHWSLKRQNTLTNEWLEHHLSPAPTILKTQNVSTLYTLKVSPNNSFSLSVNNQVISQGTFHENLVPPLEPNQQPFSFLKRYNHSTTYAIKHFIGSRLTPWFISLIPTNAFKLETVLFRYHEINKNALSFFIRKIFLILDNKSLFNITKQAIHFRYQKFTSFSLSIFNSLQNKNLNLLSQWIGFSNRFSFSAIQLDVWTLNGGAIFDNIVISDNEKSVYQFLSNTWIPLNTKTFLRNASSLTCPSI